MQHLTLTPISQVAFRLFGPADTPEDCTLPPSRSVERMIYEAKLRETIYSFSSNVALCASEIAESIYSMRRVPLNYVAVEVLLGDMLALPKSRAPTAFYHAVLAELVRTTAPFADALTLGMDHIFHRLDKMDVEVSLLALGFFSMHRPAHFVYSVPPRFRSGSGIS